MRGRLLFGLALTFGLIPAFANCRDATQMVVEVTTDIPCARNPKTNIAVGRLGALAGKTTTATDVCTANGTIGTLVIVPSGEDNEEVAFEITVAIGVDPSTCTDATSKSCIVARRDLHFLPHETVRINVPMKQVCAGVSCDPTTTCYAGGCVSATINQSLCRDDVCGEDVLGPARVITPDGGVDAGPSFTGDITDMQMGEDHTCMISQGKVYCWGWNLHGQVGAGEGFTDATRPMLVSSLTTTITAIATGPNLNGAIDSSGQLFMWGYPGSGAFLGENQDRFTPKHVTDPSFGQLDAFSTGDVLACGLDHAAGDLVCWGYIYSTDPPVYVAPKHYPTGGGTVTSLKCGDFGVVVRKDDGTFLTMGQANEALGRGYPDAGVDGGADLAAVSLSPGYVVSGTGVQDTIAYLGDGGSGVVWGTNTGPTNGTFVSNDRPLPLASEYQGFSKVVVGYTHACGLRGKEVYCWGADTVGQTGEPIHGNDRSLPPRKVPLPGDIDGLWGGGNHNCARLASNKTVYCWGANDHGQLGNGTTTIIEGADIYHQGGHPDISLLLAP